MDGVRVLDLSIWRPGPYATQLLAELGADVVKVEPPGGDPMRAYPALFAELNVNKRSVVLDLKSEAGRARAAELARDADVVVEGFRPGVAARLGVGWEEVSAVNPSVVYCSVSGFGQTGPLVDVPGHDVNYQAWSGALAPAGGTPVESALPVADLAGGMAAAFAICASLVRRASSGDGERIDVSMSDVLATWTGAQAPTDTGGEVPGYGVFETADGWIALGVLTEDHFWRAVCAVAGLDGGALGFEARLARVTELQGRLRDALRGRPRDEVVAELLAAGAPVAPVLDRAAMAQHEQFRSRGTVRPGPATGYPVLFARRPARVDAPAPSLDAHAGEGFR
jgi:crotonobetainyl-CoA:carnitine CoA-transferase CaiB-like acyl-CoA transferase